MKKVLIIHAHPEPKSFNMALMNCTKEFFEANGDSVKVSDLYAMNFDPVGGKHDFTEIANPEFFKYQQEQVHAFVNGHFVPGLKEEMEKLEWCNILIFVFPLWWFGMPAILKGWVDRVFAMGFVYGAGKGVYENGVYPEKTAFAIVTTGGPEVAYGAGGKNGDIIKILFPLHHGIYYFAGMTALPPFVSFAPARSSEEELSGELERMRHYLSELENLKPLYTNQ